MQEKMRGGFEKFPVGSGGAQPQLPSEKHPSPARGGCVVKGSGLRVTSDAAAREPKTDTAFPGECLGIAGAGVTMTATTGPCAAR